MRGYPHHEQELTQPRPRAPQTADGLRVDHRQLVHLQRAAGNRAVVTLLRSAAPDVQRHFLPVDEEAPEMGLQRHPGVTVQRDRTQARIDESKAKVEHAIKYAEQLTDRPAVADVAKLYGSLISWKVMTLKVEKTKGIKGIKGKKKDTSGQKFSFIMGNEKNGPRESYGAEIGGLHDPAGNIAFVRAFKPKAGAKKASDEEPRSDREIANSIVHEGTHVLSKTTSVEVKTDDDAEAYRRELKAYWHEDRFEGTGKARAANIRALMSTPAGLVEYPYMAKLSAKEKSEIEAEVSAEMDAGSNREAVYARNPAMLRLITKAQLSEEDRRTLRKLGKQELATLEANGLGTPPRFTSRKTHEIVAGAPAGVYVYWQGTEPFKVVADEEGLPPGMTGTRKGDREYRITGTPDTPGTYTMVVDVKNNIGEILGTNARQKLRITVKERTEQASPSGRQ